LIQAGPRPDDRYNSSNRPNPTTAIESDGMHALFGSSGFFTPERAAALAAAMRATSAPSASGLVPFVTPHYSIGRNYVREGDRYVEHFGETRDERLEAPV
jgi:hypothetical protein